jgi:hypothetical protein
MNLTFRPGQAFGVKAPVTHANDILRFYEIIYVIFDVMKDESIKFYKIEAFHQSSPFIQPQMDKAILLSDNRSLYHQDRLIFKKMLLDSNAESL